MARKISSMSEVSGNVLTNDGNCAEVVFPNGDRRFFKRDFESRDEFAETFPVNRTVKVEYCEMKVNDRDSLFEHFKKIFGEPQRYGVMVLGNSKTAVIGQTLDYGAVVFCSPECFHPGEDKGFAVALRTEIDPNATVVDKESQTLWFTFAQVDIEDAMALVARHQQKAAMKQGFEWMGPHGKTAQEKN